jgi:large subunit ribosomal protein L35Ae
MVKKLDRLYSRGIFLGYRRGISLQNTNQGLVRIEGVKSREEAKWYLGKRLAYVYKAKKEAKKGPTNFRSIQGKVISVHGNNGVVRASFSPNLPGQAVGKLVRVLLYPFRPSS